MDIHGVKEGYHKMATQKNLYDIIKESDKIITL